MGGSNENSHSPPYGHCRRCRTSRYRSRSHQLTDRIAGQMTFPRPGLTGYRKAHAQTSLGIPIAPDTWLPETTCRHRGVGNARRQVIFMIHRT